MKSEIPIEKFDTVIIGAGPAGLMAAIEAHTPDHKTAVLEKMPKPALKLKITGKGRCNITNSADLQDFLKHFGKNGRFLKFAFSEFFSNDLLSFFEKSGVRFKLERGGRYFPENDSAMEIAAVLTNQVKLLGVPVLTNTKIKKIEKRTDGRFYLKTELKDGKSVLQKHFVADQVILAAGGKSYPRTGSSGDGYFLAEKLGHTVTQLSPSLVPVKTKGSTAKKLQNLNLKNVNAAVWSGSKKAADEFGEILFTDFGVSGPAILTLSNTIVKLLDSGQEAEIAIDLKPALDHKKLDKRLLREIKEHPRQSFKYLLKQLLPQKMIPVFIESLEIPADKKLAEINAAERKKLRLLLKEFKLEASGYCSFEQAIITKGGVSIKEISPQTMESRLVKGLYFAGEIIDIDADTGGFNLQAAFSTGWIAGRAVKNSICNK